ncbi:response regulator [Myxococcota bacterium]|nr:response regulator [Myxococcota bacterium]
MQLRVLIVDDAIASRAALRALAEEAHLTVVGEASNGLEAVDRHQQLRPDLVLMDLVMPHLNGTDAARQILALDPSARIIAVSGLSQPSVMNEVQRSGILGFLTKPVELTDLLAEVRDVMTR